ncbi:MAG TPA: endolytic transglycosylase MltG [Erysipelotrichaceae bacterium]|nr:endolytic transglycosylase MltG [Erysipelotrichaceae bacterium]
MSDNNETLELETIKKGRKKKKPVVLYCVLILLVVLVGILGFTAYRFFDAQKAVQSEPETVSFTVESGTLPKTAIANLDKEGIIRDGQMAYYFARLNKLTDIKAGDYTLDKSWDLEKILTFLNDPKAANQETVTVTIIPGDWAKDAAKKISAATTVSYDDLINLWNNREWITSMMGQYPFLTEEMFKDGVRIYLEGYLAPDTYQFLKETTAEDVTKKLLDQSLAVYNQFAADMAASEYSIHQLYTLASIVQYEAGSNGADGTQQKVASVFYNRLKAGMMLQSSVTVCYAIDFDKETDNWMACEVNSNFESPYNTYKYGGFPPGAINNPSAEAINSTLHPEQTDYYYFMADVYGDGTVYFAKTLEEHNANVRKYLHQ